MAKCLLVSIVDDDESVREALPDLLQALGYSAQAFSSAEEFLASDYVSSTKCLILDLSMPGMSGPDLQRELALRPQQIPVVFITAHEVAAERLHGDDTTVPVLAEGKTDTGRCWVYLRDDEPFGGAGPPAAMFY